MGSVAIPTRGTLSVPELPVKAWALHPGTHWNRSPSIAARSPACHCTSIVDPITQCVSKPALSNVFTYTFFWPRKLSKKDIDSVTVTVLVVRELDDPVTLIAHRPFPNSP